jgi:hypothetical protein
MDNNTLRMIVITIDISKDETKGITQVKFSRTIRISPGNFPIFRFDLDNK